MPKKIKGAISCLLAVILLASLAATLNAEPARTNANNNGTKVGKQEPKKKTTITPNKNRKGDNRDDAKSGKIDRPGDGNSGQGDDKNPPKNRRGDNRDDAKSGKIDRPGDGNSGQGDDKKSGVKPKHDPRTCPICKRHLPPLPPKKQHPQTTNKDNSGVRDRGQGEGRDDVGQGKGQGDENRKGNSLRKKWGADRREDVKDRKEERRDNREDVRDRREDRKDRREDKRDNKYPPKRKWGAGDNRDDNKSGKIDRPGDGNSGQGNDRKREGNDRPKVRPNQPQGGSSANTPDKRRGDNRDDAKSGKVDRPGDGNSGQGNDKDARLRPPHNPRTCPICNPRLKNDGKNRKPGTSQGNSGISGTVPKNKGNEGVRDGGKGEGRDSAGQDKGQGDTNKENKENSKK